MTGMEGAVETMTDTMARVKIGKGLSVAAAQRAMRTAVNTGLKNKTTNDGTVLAKNFHTTQELIETTGGTSTLVDLQRTPLAGGRSNGRGPDGQTRLSSDRAPYAPPPGGGGDPSPPARVVGRAAVGGGSGVGPPAIRSYG